MLPISLLEPQTRNLCLFLARSRISLLIKQHHLASASTPPDVFVDMYCGIGYFTLPVLLRCPAEMLSECWTCDLNPNTIQVMQAGWLVLRCNFRVLEQ